MGKFAWVDALRCHLATERSKVNILQSQLDAAMHKETAMCLELERERGRLDWYVEVGANINVHDGAEWQTVVVVDGNIRAAIDEAMEGGE